MAELRWTPTMVEERLIEAADTLRRLPAVKVRGHLSSWPPVVHEFWEAFGWHDVAVRRGPASPGAIDRMDETLQWLRHLEPDDARLVWQRSDGAPWKAICWRFGMSRATAWRHWVAGLATIATRLNSGAQTSVNRRTVKVLPFSEGRWR